MKSDFHVYIASQNKHSDLHFYKGVYLNHILQYGTVLICSHVQIRLILKEVSIDLEQEIIVYKFYNESSADYDLYIDYEKIVEVMKKEKWHKLI